MKNTKLGFLFLSALTCAITQAQSYEVRYDIEHSHVKFTNTVPPEVPETPVVPTYGEWVNSGVPYNCSSWTPSKNTILSGVSFPQSRSCEQLQIREVNEGALPSETQVINVSNSQNGVGVLNCPAYSLGAYGLGAYGEVGEASLGNPNYGTRISWNSQLIYDDLDQSLKPDRTEVTVGSFVYVRKTNVATRNIVFNYHNYKSYDYSVCRYPVE